MRIHSHQALSIHFYRLPRPRCRRCFYLGSFSPKKLRHSFAHLRFGIFIHLCCSRLRHSRSTTGGAAAFVAIAIMKMMRAILCGIYRKNEMILIYICVKNVTRLFYCFKIFCFLSHTSASFARRAHCKLRRKAEFMSCNFFSFFSFSFANCHMEYIYHLVVAFATTWNETL